MEQFEYFIMFLMHITVKRLWLFFLLLHTWEPRPFVLSTSHQGAMLCLALNVGVVTPEGVVLVRDKL